MWTTECWTLLEQRIYFLPLFPEKPKETSCIFSYRYQVWRRGGGGLFTGVIRPKGEADHHFRTVLRSTMRQFVPARQLHVFIHLCWGTVTAIPYMFLAFIYNRLQHQTPDRCDSGMWGWCVNWPSWYIFKRYFSFSCRLWKALKQNFWCATQMWKSVCWIRIEQLTMTFQTAVAIVWRHYRHSGQNSRIPGEARDNSRWVRGISLS